MNPKENSLLDEFATSLYSSLPVTQQRIINKAAKRRKITWLEVVKSGLARLEPKDKSEKEA